MSILDFLFGNKSSDNNTSDTADVVDATPRHRNAGNYAFVDAEVGMKGLSGNLVGISINLCKSIQKELFINDTP